jgi:hypothetical protein
MQRSPNADAGTRGEPLDPVTICRLLATEERLRVVAALALGASTTEEVAIATGLRRRDLLQSLNRLAAGGLVVDDGKDGWRLRASAFADAVRAGVEAEEPQHEDHGTTDAKEAAVLRVFMPAGRLVAIPASMAKRRIVLDQVARLFEPGVRYPEREVKAVLRAVCAPPGAARGGDAYAPAPDHVTLRRYLVDEGFLAREGGVYWRAGGSYQLD